MAAQLPLPLVPRTAVSREDFIVAPGNTQAVAFIDSWPHWPVHAVAIFGPSGSGKSHLVAVWQARSAALRVSAADLGRTGIGDVLQAFAVEDVDSSAPSRARDAALFALLEHATRDAPILLTGHEPPAEWQAVLPDLTSRLNALVSFPLWAPDDALLAALAHKLFADRQLNVPDVVVQRMVHSLERTPGAVRAFVAQADAKALAEGRAVSLPLVRELLAARDPASS